MNKVSIQASDLVSVNGLKKHFGGVKALDGVDLYVRHGEVHALVGENGAGKSTLIKVLTGVHVPTEGDIQFDKLPFETGSPQRSKDIGIQVVHQEFNLLEHLSVAENIAIEQFPTTKWGLLDKTRMRKQAESAVAAIGLKDLDVTRPVSSLGIAHRQLVEIARALQSESRLLILDEPTATLTDREKNNLFEIMEQVKAKGVSILFVTHHLDEVFATCDRVTVFRNGKTVITENISETSPEKVVSNMVGRHVDHTAVEENTDKTFGDIVLSTENLFSDASTSENGITLEVKAGEILGIAGLVGAGRTELLRAIFAADKARGGVVKVNGELVSFSGPREAIDAGIGFVTEDRKQEGLILDMSIAANGSMVNLWDLFGRVWMHHRKEHEQAMTYAQKLQLKFGKTSDPASSLSGGNQQKVVLSKWLASKPKLLMLDEPTRGVDVGAKFEIYTILRALASEGVAMLVVSSELPELMTLCDRIAVMSNHEITGTLARTEFDEERILQLAYGQTKN